MTTGPSGPVEARKPKSRIVSFRVDEDDFARLDALARQTSYSRGEVLRRCLRGARLESTVDAQALHEARVRRKRDWSRYRDTAGAERRRLKRKYRQQQHLLAALPVPGQDRERLFRQLEIRQTIETRAVKQKHATQRWAIQKTPHPGTWHHFGATRAAERDAPSGEPAAGRDRSSEEREL